MNRYSRFATLILVGTLAAAAPGHQPPPQPAPGPKPVPSGPGAQPPAPPTLTPSAPAAPPKAPTTAPAQPKAAILICAQRGDLPIILAAPHGGSVRVPGSEERTKGVKARDMRTADVALLLSQRLTERLGARPYYIIAQFSRKDVDANRDFESGEAYENDAAKVQYDAYHAALKRSVEECRARFGVAILIDLHGQTRVPEAIVRGTRNGKTVSSLMRRLGRDALIGPDSIMGRIKAAGYEVLPGLEAQERETDIGHEDFLDGGYTVARYGSHNSDGVDAIQLELGSQRSEDLLKLCRVLGEAVSAFSEKYLFPECKPGSLPPRVPVVAVEGASSK